MNIGKSRLLNIYENITQYCGYYMGFRLMKSPPLNGAENFFCSASPYTYNIWFTRKEKKKSANFLQTKFHWVFRYEEDGVALWFNSVPQFCRWRYLTIFPGQEIKQTFLKSPNKKLQKLIIDPKRKQRNCQILRQLNNS